MMVHKLPPQRPTSLKHPRAFTLVEMLIAMAVTLILVTALATGFSFVGQSIRDGRGEVQLSNQLRDITERLREELDSMTVSLRPNNGEADQLGYFMYYEGPVTDATSALFGIDTNSEGVAQIAHSRYGDFDDYLAFTAVATGDKWFTGKVPRFILDQKTAELRGEVYDPTASGNPYFGTDPLSPVMIRSKYAEIVYFASPEYDTSTLGTNTPVYVDTDGTSDIGLGSAFQNGIPDNLRLHRRVLLIRPDLNLASGQISRWSSGGVNYMLADAWPTTTPTNNAWMYGMAGVHQQCDLSLRRVQATNGLPTQNVAANSLADLAKPHNRFAHVRVPGGLIGLSTAVTSMPVLALGPPANILNATTVNGTRMAPPLASGGGSIVLPPRMAGFLRPEFVLGQDPAHPTTTGDTWGLERIGEDLLANNVLSFDVKIYDPQAVSITTSNNMVVGTNDPGFREALRAHSSGSVMSGDYVDLAYPVLAGGSFRGVGAMPLDRSRTDTVTIPTANISHLLTPFSGVSNFAGGLGGTYAESLLRSGKVLTDNSQIQLFQPTFDTFTSSYETDGFVQGYQRASPLISPTDVGGAGYGTRWTTANTATIVDLGRNGLDDDGTFGADDVRERETGAPFMSNAPAVRITLRLENRDNRQLMQASVVHRDEG